MTYVDDSGIWDPVYNSSSLLRKASSGSWTARSLVIVHYVNGTKYLMLIISLSSSLFECMDRVRKTFREAFLSQEDAQENRLKEKASAVETCKTLVVARENCWKNSVAQTKETDECYREELAEKQCLAECLCSNEAKAFYKKTDCHLYSEYFAHQDEAKYKAGREKILRDPALLQLCRELTMNLANCMFRYNTTYK